MAPRHDDDWSDSDDEVLSEVETPVLLGVPDGVVQVITDITDAAVSRVGGHPVRFTPMYYHTELSHLYSSRTRPFFLRVNPLYLRPNAKFVQTHPSSSFKCGVRSRTAQWIVPYIFGAARGLHARARMGGKV